MNIVDIINIPNPLDTALDLFASSKDDCLAYLRNLHPSEVQELEGLLIDSGFDHAEFIAWYLEQNIATLPFILTMALAAYAYKKITKGAK